MSTVADNVKRGYRTIRLPLAEPDYERFLNDKVFCRVQLDQLYEQYPELFPAGWEHGYGLCSKTSASRKLRSALSTGSPEGKRGGVYGGAGVHDAVYEREGSGG